MTLQRASRTLLAGLWLFMIGCTGKDVSSPPLPPMPPEELSVCEVRLGASVTELRNRKPHLFPAAQWEILAAGNTASMLSEGCLIRLDVEAGLVVAAYGLSLSTSRGRLTSGDSVGSLLEVCGPPDQILDQDHSPEQSLTYAYRRMGLEVDVSRDRRRIVGGFTLSRPGS